MGVACVAARSREWAPRAVDGEGARELLDGRSTSAHVRATFEAESPWDAELWKSMVDQGWTGIAVAEEVGGVGLGWVEAAVLLEEVGGHVAPAPILQQIVALDALTRATLG